MRNLEQFTKVKVQLQGQVETPSQKNCCSCGKVVDDKKVYLCWPDGQQQHFECWADDDIDNGKKEKPKKA